MSKIVQARCPRCDKLGYLRKIELMWRVEQTFHNTPIIKSKWDCMYCSSTFEESIPYLEVADMSSD